MAMKIFNTVDKTNHADQHTEVTIGSGSSIVSGYLTSQFNVKSSAQFEKLFNFGTGKFKLLDTYMKLKGAPIMASSQFQMRFYNGGNYLSFPLQFRVVNYDGKKDIQKMAETLIRYTLPVDLKFEDVVGKATTISYADATEEGLETAKKAVNADRVNVGGLLDDSFSALSRASQGYGVGPVPVKVGNYLSGNFIITSVDVTYSKEIIRTSTKTGPLFADFNVTIETQTIPSKNFDDGITHMNLTGTDSRVYTKSKKDGQ